MAGFYPPLAPHEIDDLGDLGRRIQETIIEIERRSAEAFDDVEYMEGENNGVTAGYKILERAMKTLRSATKNKNHHSIIDKALDDAKEALDV